MAIRQSGDLVKVGFSWKGIADMKAELRAMPDKIRAKGVRMGVTAASKAIRDQVRAYAPIESGSLRNSINYKIVRYPSRKRKNSYVFVGVIGPDRNWKLAARSSWGRIVTRAVRPVWYAHLMEKGVRPHYTLQPRGNLTVAIPHPGVRATRFMSRGVQVATPAAARAMERAVRRAIDRYQKGKA
jgi:hypothetical protein